MWSFCPGQPSLLPLLHTFSLHFPPFPLSALIRVSLIPLLSIPSCLTLLHVLITRPLSLVAVFWPASPLLVSFIYIHQNNFLKYSFHCTTSLWKKQQNKRSNLYLISWLKVQDSPTHVQICFLTSSTPPLCFSFFSTPLFSQFPSGEILPVCFRIQIKISLFS